ncbi:MAG: methyl-accepting chemotaxis protein [Ktedonobacterales bacterium]|nr:methyl-accepting chemotaxis protein [Ktedonobacterales bacterium]
MFSLDTPEEPGEPFYFPRGPWGLWLRVIMPHIGADALMNSTIRERLRRAQILSTLVFGLFCVSVGLIPLAFLPSFNAGAFGGVVLGFIIVLFTTSLCRANRVTTASTLYVLGIVIAISIGQSLFPDNKIGLQDIEPFDLFVVPIVFAGILLPRVWSIVIWAYGAIFTIVILSIIPHRSNLDQYLAGSGIYAVVVQPILLSALLAVVSWIAAGSVNRAIEQGDRTAEVTRAYQSVTDQKQRLEDAIAIIRDVHARVANGDLTARAPTVKGELLPVAVSLNLMLERLSRSLAAESALGGMEQSVQRLNDVVSQLAQGNIRHPIPQQAFGPLNPVAYNLEQLRNGFVQVTRNSNALVNRIHTMTQEMLQQQHMLDQALVEQIPYEDRAFIQSMQERLSHMEADLTNGIEQLQRFLARFAA